jgi:pSer/pThr/pTyr-binding forkhead associated (FHA) protein
MLCLISTISRHGKTGAVYHDRIVNVDLLTLGRAVDQHVFLPDLRVALQHATISDLGRGRFGIEAKSASGIRINDRLVQESLLHVGDTIRIGNALIRVVEPRHGYDLVLEVGPGLGFLTTKLAAKVKKVVAVELDDRLAAYLQMGVDAQEATNIEIINGDILKFDLAAYLLEYGLVGKKYSLGRWACARNKQVG